jgi:hypothetical protein
MVTINVVYLPGYAKGQKSGVFPGQYEWGITSREIVAILKPGHGAEIAGGC